MSSTPPATAPAQAPKPPFSDAPFLDRLMLWLMPYFLTVTSDRASASTEIFRTLRSYGARTRAELLSAAQIIAFGFSALDTLAEASTTEMSASMRLRYKGCANNLSRNGQKTEQILASRLACELGEATQPPAEPYDDLPDPQFEQAMAQAEANIEAYRKRAPSAHPSVLPSRAQPASQQEANKRMWGQAMANVLAEMGMPVQPAARKSI
jgi:hypothetical protein